MRIRKLICSFFLILCMVAGFGLTVFAAESDDSNTSSYAVRTVSGKSYLYNTTSDKPVTGYSGIKEVPAGSGNYYYFSTAKSGQIYRSCWVKKGSKYYYANSNGTLRSGWQTINNKTYYFSAKTHARATGWTKLSGKYYYFNTKGVQIKGWLTWKKYKYYLDPTQNGVKLTGWNKISGKTYYFNTKGRLQKGWLTINNKKYYCDTNGIRKTGLVTINGKKYYFAKKTGVMKTGFITVSNRTYYFSKASSNKGQAVSGWLTKSGAKYYFNSSGVMQKGWMNYKTNKYYFDPTTGKMYTGKHVISGTTYDFGTSGGIAITVTGAWSIKVNRRTCVVTIYRGNTPIKAMLCSVGLAATPTPTGTYYITDQMRWHTLMGPSYGQYCSRISYRTGGILFHSIPYNNYNDPYSMPPSAYNMLGQPASHGCIRLNAAGAKYIFDNCKYGTNVVIFDGTAADDPLPRPYLSKVSPSQNYDPTDPNL